MSEVKILKHIVGLSGGIDSQALLRYVRNAYGDKNVIALNTRAGRNESPLTDQFIDNFSASVFPVVTVVPLVKDLWETERYAEKRGFNGDEELTFQKLIEIKGRATSRTRQFCTSFLKLIPIRRWTREHFGPGGQYEGQEFERYTGVRRDESEGRRNQAFREWDEFFDCWLNAPLADWTKKQCFDYVENHGEQYNPLYKLGFNRVGCAPCINSGKDDILLWLQRFPEMIEKVRGYEQATGRTFFAPCVPGLAVNTIDDVITWAQTDRGGRQANMFRILNERPSCESKYGLCE
jgi:3'-phosphoadenosine 5'-phosphosulfate sulfotransferase (PAPS reductase)/FAD synthetase